LQTIRAACAQVDVELTVLLASAASRPLQALVPVCTILSADVAPTYTPCSLIPLHYEEFKLALFRTVAAFSQFATAFSAARSQLGDAALVAGGPAAAFANFESSASGCTRGQQHHLEPNTYTLSVTPIATQCFICGRALPYRSRCFLLDVPPREVFVDMDHFMCFSCHARHISQSKAGKY
jgi:hypothetical protein